jgi:hypothetical protein
MVRAGTERTRCGPTSRQKRRQRGPGRDCEMGLLGGYGKGSCAKIQARVTWCVRVVTGVKQADQRLEAQQDLRGNPGGSGARQARI